MLLPRRAARTHLVASRRPKYFLRLRSAGSASPGSGRPVRLVRLRPGVSPQTLQTPPRGGRPVLRGPRGGFAPPSARSSLLRRLPRPARHYPRLWLRTPLGVGPAGLQPARNMRRPARTTAASDALPTRDPFPGLRPVIGRGAPAGFPQPAGPGRASPVPARRLLSVPSPIRREVPGGCASRLFTPSVAFAVNSAARLLLFPSRGPLTTRQASRDATDRSVAPPDGAFDAGLRRRAFPPDAASLLPGLLAEIGRASCR